MTHLSPDHAERMKRRRAHEARNLFMRMPVAYAASRSQSQKLLQLAGGLSVLEWRVLWDLHEVGPMSIRDLAELQRTDHSQLSRALPDMRRKGYVTMERDSADGRQTVVQMAKAGRAAFDRAAPIMKRRREALNAAFTAEERDTFVALFDRLDAFLRRPIDTIVQSEPSE